MKIKSLMRSPCGIVDASEPLAAATMRLTSAPGACLVATERGHVVGVLTDVDARAAGPSTIEPMARYAWPDLAAKLRVVHAMRPNPLVLATETTTMAMARMLRARRERVAVVTEGTEVLGVVTAYDLLRALVERLEGGIPGALTRLLVAVSLPISARGGRGVCTPLEVAADLARRHAATLTVLHVIRGLSPRVAEGLPAGVEADVHRWRRSQARETLVGLVARHGLPSVRIEVGAGDVTQAVLECGLKTGAELIVMGGRPAAAIVYTTMRQAPCPVLAV